MCKYVYKFLYRKDDNYQIDTKTVQNVASIRHLFSK